MPVLLVVAAAALGSVRAKETAFVEVVLFESSSNGEYTTFTTDLQGRFSRAGATISAEGEIVQVKVTPIPPCSGHELETVVKSLAEWLFTQQDGSGLGPLAEQRERGFKYITHRLSLV